MESNTNRGGCPKKQPNGKQRPFKRGESEKPDELEKNLFKRLKKMEGIVLIVTIVIGIIICIPLCRVVKKYRWIVCVSILWVIMVGSNIIIAAINGRSIDGNIVAYWIGEAFVYALVSGTIGYFIGRPKK